MILTYYKVKDDLSDKGFLSKARALLLLPFASSARKKALSLGGEAEKIDLAAKRMVEEQKAVEERKSPLSDEAAEPTAKFLSEIMTLGGKEENKRILERFGYLLGRYIYLCDALDDLEDDVKKGNYNPFVASGKDWSWEDWEQVLVLCMQRCATYFEKLPLVQDKVILDNILYSGVWLQYRQKQRQQTKHQGGRE
jgi:hypothetical protein